MPRSPQKPGGYCDNPNASFTSERWSLIRILTTGCSACSKRPSRGYQPQARLSWSRVAWKDALVSGETAPKNILNSFWLCFPRLDRLGFGDQHGNINDLQAASGLKYTLSRIWLSCLVMSTPSVPPGYVVTILAIVESSHYDCKLFKICLLRLLQEPIARPFFCSSACRSSSSPLLKFCSSVGNPWKQNRGSEEAVRICRISCILGGQGNGSRGAPPENRFSEWYEVSKQPPSHHVVTDPL